MTTIRATSSTPTWVIRPGGALAVQVHRPQNGEARGVVVLAPPIAREWAITYRAMRSLACQLTDEGFIAVRFAFTGDGDSQGRVGDDLAGELVSDLAAVVELARSLAPDVPLSVIGLRMGACVAAMLPERARGNLLAWEPVEPRRWLRGQRAIRRLSVSTPPRSDLGTEILGALYTKAQVSSLRNLAEPGATTPACAVRHEADESVSSALYATDVAHATTPFASLDEIVAWVPRSAPRPARAWSPVVSYVETTTDGAVSHTFTAITEFGLPAVVSESLDRESSCTVVCAQGSMESMCGPGGLWAQMSGPLAAAGARVIRTDRRGTGDLSNPMRHREPLPYSDRGVEDYRAIVRACADRGRPIVCVGICAGAWYAGLSARGGGVDRVVGFNNPVWGLSPRPYRALLAAKDRINVARGVFDLATAAAGTSPEPVEGTSVAKAEDTGLVRGRGPVWTLLIAAARWAVGAVPDGLRLRAARVGLAQDPSVLVGAAPSDTSFDYLFGNDDWPSFASIGGDDAFVEPRAGGQQITSQRQDVLDHGLLSVDARTFVTEYLRGVVRDLTASEAERRGDGLSDSQETSKGVTP